MINFRLWHGDRSNDRRQKVSIYVFSCGLSTFI